MLVTWSFVIRLIEDMMLLCIIGVDRMIAYKAGPSLMFELINTKRL